MKSKHICLFFIGIVIGLGLLVYSNTFHVPFLFDDDYSILSNVFIRNIHDLKSIVAFFPRRCILYLSLALNYHFNGYNVIGYHLFNLVIHLLTACMVWWLVRLTLSTPLMKKEKIAWHLETVAFFAALIFVAHPLQTEAVTYIVQRIASMATLFYLASLCFFVQSRLLQLNQPNSNTWKAYYVSSLIMAVTAMFTKETAITLPLMILLYEFTFIRTERKFSWGLFFPFMLTFLIIPMTMLLTENRPDRIHYLTSEPGISPIHYLLTQFRVMMTYIRLAFLPFNQNLDYDYPVFKSIFEWPVLCSFAVLMVILYCAKHFFFKYRFLSFSIFWFFLALLPESSIMPIKDVIFEHRLYLPMVGYSMFLAGGVYYLCKGNIKWMAIVLTMFVGVYSLMTYQRNEVWKSEFSIWDDVVKKSPQKARGFRNRALAYYHQNNLKKAMADFDKAIALNPNFAEAYNSRGVAYAGQGDLDDAVSDFTKSIEADPHDEKAYYNRGLIFAKKGNLSYAIADFSRAIIEYPIYIDAYYNRGLIYAKQKDYRKALKDLDMDIVLNPQDAQAYSNRAVVSYELGQYAKAREDIAKAEALGLSVNPIIVQALKQI